mgnify:CR=1 FL=1
MTARTLESAITPATRALEIDEALAAPAVDVIALPATPRQRGLSPWIVGAVAAVASVLPKVAPQVAAPVQADLPKPERGGGYTLSEHVKRYYQTTRV